MKICRRAVALSRRTRCSGPTGRGGHPSSCAAPRSAPRSGIVNPSPSVVTSPSRPQRLMTRMADSTVVAVQVRDLLPRERERNRHGGALAPAQPLGQHQEKARDPPLDRPCQVREPPRDLELPQHQALQEPPRHLADASVPARGSRMRRRSLTLAALLAIGTSCVHLVGVGALGRFGHRCPERHRLGLHQPRGRPAGPRRESKMRRARCHTTSCSACGGVPSLAVPARS